MTTGRDNRVEHEQDPPDMADAYALAFSDELDDDGRCPVCRRPLCTCDEEPPDRDRSRRPSPARSRADR